MPTAPIIRAPLTHLACLAICLGLGAWGGPALAHAVFADGVRDEWGVVLPIASNLGMIVRTTLGTGEYAWRDAPGDQRTDLGAAGVGADILELRVTADATNLALLVQLSDVVITTGEQAPMLQVALDLDALAGSGGTWMTGFADTQVGDSARWERLVYTRFGSGGGASVLDADFNVVASAEVAIDAADDILEIVIPWSALGLAGPPATPIRFTVASYLADAGDNTLEIGGSSVSDALDTITNYGDPRASSYPSTFTEVGDTRVDYAFDVEFDGASGEVESPWLLTEVLYNSATASLEWAEIVNVSARALCLNGMKLGDEETPDGTEGMRKFPQDHWVSAGASRVAAISGTAFQTAHIAPPDFEIVATLPGVPDLPAYAPWATGIFSLANAGDEVLLLDRWDTVLDVLNYGSGVFPGHASHFTILAEHSLERAPVAMDRNDSSLDFADQSTPNPWPSTLDAPGARPSAALALSVFPNPLRSTARIRLSLGQAGFADVQVIDVAGRVLRSLSWSALPSGANELVWDLDDDAGRALPNGRYFVRARSGGRTWVRSVALVR